jgi:glycine N-methyltransferase
MTLLDDTTEIFGDGFDAVICLGNSFSHMPDTSGDRQNQRYFLIFTLEYVVTCLITLQLL